MAEGSAAKRARTDEVQRSSSASHIGESDLHEETGSHDEHPDSMARQYRAWAATRITNADNNRAEADRKGKEAEVHRKNKEFDDAKRLEGAAERLYAQADKLMSEADKFMAEAKELEKKA